jgi:hypothetical protein
MANRCVGSHATLKRARVDQPAGFGLQGFETTEGALGFPPTLPSRAGDAGPSDSQIKHRGTIREERVTGSASGGKRPVRACLRVTRRASEIDAVR